MTQRQDILDYLLDGNALTSAEAIKKFGCTRLASQVNALREKGYPIETTYRLAINRYGTSRNIAVYRMDPDYLAKQWLDQRLEKLNGKGAKKYEPEKKRERNAHPV